MIQALIYVVWAAIFFAALLQVKNISKLYPVAVYAAASWGHALAFESVESDLVYFGSAGLFDLLVICLLAGVRKPSKHLLIVMCVSFFSIIGNMGGYLVFQSANIPEEFYSIFMLILNLIVLWTTINSDMSDERTNGLSDYFSFAGRNWFGDAFKNMVALCSAKY